MFRTVEMVTKIQLHPHELRRILQFTTVVEAIYAKGYWPTFAPITVTTNCGVLSAALAQCSDAVRARLSKLTSRSMSYIQAAYVEHSVHLPCLTVGVPRTPA